MGVGHTADIGVTPCGGGLGSRDDGFFVGESRFAEVNVKVHKPRADPESGAVIGFVRVGDVRLFSQFAYLVINDDEVPHGIQVLGWIKDSAVFEDDLHYFLRFARVFLLFVLVDVFLGSLFGVVMGFWVWGARSEVKTAIRTKMPFSTCLRMREWAPSAVRSSNSTPRLMGPGCITRQSSLADVSVLVLI